MIKVAIYGEILDKKHHQAIQLFFEQMQVFKIECVIFEKYKEIIDPIVSFKGDIKTFSNKSDLETFNVNYMISIGGDGTMLNSFRLLFNTEIPVFGINTGRLGFLSNVSTDRVNWALNELVAGRFSNRIRSVLEINCSGQDEKLYAVNEVAIHKQDTSSMLTIHAKLNDVELTSYWADGVLISTPTGSTAYSLSCGGPIVMPGSENFLVTPIAPHNLAVRPLVYRDDKILKLEVESRSDKFLLAYDSNSITLSSDQMVSIKKAPFYIHLLKFEDYSYLNMLRSKLMWGADKRN
ncbi:MAG: NAD kinase [Bacteroidetes bacterium]|nr:MAG: NAD kinase [Bacteroidota bacterium]